MRGSGPWNTFDVQRGTHRVLEVLDTWKYAACCHHDHPTGPAGSGQAPSSRAGFRPCVQGLQRLFGESCWKDIGQMPRARVCIYISVELTETLSGQGLK